MQRMKQPLVARLKRIPFEFFWPVGCLVRTGNVAVVWSLVDAHTRGEGSGATSQIADHETNTAILFKCQILSSRAALDISGKCRDGAVRPIHAEARYQLAGECEFEQALIAEIKWQQHTAEVDKRTAGASVKRN